jgi:hypothetical protein
LSAKGIKKCNFALISKRCITLALSSAQRFFPKKRFFATVPKNKFFSKFFSFCLTQEFLQLFKISADLLLFDTLLRAISKKFLLTCTSGG